MELEDKDNYTGTSRQWYTIDLACNALYSMRKSQAHPLDFNTALVSPHPVLRKGGKEKRYSLELIHATLVEFNCDLLTCQVTSKHYFRGSLEPKDLILWTATIDL